MKMTYRLNRIVVIATWILYFCASRRSDGACPASAEGPACGDSHCSRLPVVASISILCTNSSWLSSAFW